MLLCGVVCNFVSLWVAVCCYVLLCVFLFAIVSYHMGWLLLLCVLTCFCVLLCVAMCPVIYSGVWLCVVVRHCVL